MLLLTGCCASDGQAQTNPSEGGLGAYQSLTEKINSLNTEAGIAFDDHNYKSAAEGFGAVIKLVNDNIDRMREQLKEAKGITDGAGNPLTGAQLIEKLTKSAGTAANNQNLAINKVMIEEYNTLVTDYKRFVDDKDPAVVKREMQSIVDKSIKALKTEGLKDKVKAEFEKLESAAQQRLKDSAMNTFNQPVGGIDFNSQNLDLQVTGDVGQMDMPIDSTAWDNVKIQGLVPAIIEIKPVSDWGVF